LNTEAQGHREYISCAHIHKFDTSIKKAMLYIIGIILITGFSINDQKSNYLEYHTNFGQVEELIVNENFTEVELRLIELFDNYEVKFVKDYVIASQVSIH